MGTKAAKTFAQNKGKGKKDEKAKLKLLDMVEEDVIEILEGMKNGLKKLIRLYWCEDVQFMPKVSYARHE